LEGKTKCRSKKGTCFLKKGTHSQKKITKTWAGADRSVNEYVAKVSCGELLDLLWKQQGRQRKERKVEKGTKKKKVIQRIDSPLMSIKVASFLFRMT